MLRYVIGCKLVAPFYFLPPHASPNSENKLVYKQHQQGQVLKPVNTEQHSQKSLLMLKPLTRTTHNRIKTKIKLQTMALSVRKFLSWKLCCSDAEV